MARDLEIQVPTADITENFGVKLFLEKIQACLTFNIKENTNKLAFLKKTSQSMINLFSILFPSTMLPDSLYLIFLANNAFNSAIELSLDLSKLVPAPLALA